MRLFALVSVLSLVGYGILTRPADIPSEPDTPDMVAVSSVSPARGVPTPPPAVGGGVEGGAFVNVSEQTYAVEGETESEILASMRHMGPKAHGESFFGLTASESSFQMQPHKDGASCVTRGVRVDLNVTITLPDWAPADEVPYELQRDWTRFSTALKRHEDGHKRIAAEGAEATRAALEGLRRSSCQDVEFEARQRAEKIAARTEAEHNRYDDETDHGRTQGAAWPIR